MVNGRKPQALSAFLFSQDAKCLSSGLSLSLHNKTCIFKFHKLMHQPLKLLIVHLALSQRKTLVNTPPHPQVHFSLPLTSIHLLRMLVAQPDKGEHPQLIGSYGFERKGLKAGWVRLVGHHKKVVTLKTTGVLQATASATNQSATFTRVLCGGVFSGLRTYFSATNTNGNSIIFENMAFDYALKWYFQIMWIH